MRDPAWAASCRECGGLPVRQRKTAAYRLPFERRFTPVHLVDYSSKRPDPFDGLNEKRQPIGYRLNVVALQRTGWLTHLRGLTRLIQSAPFDFSDNENSPESI
jgi:hypothetical protein